MFRFNFLSENCKNDSKDDTDNSKEIRSIQAQQIQLDEILPRIKTSQFKDSDNVCAIFDIKYLSTPLFEFDTLQNIAHTDLKPKVYEGGYKIWECTFDLLQYLKTNVVFDSLNVLDLGCGAGLLGLYALCNRASCVYFQDYNEEVIKALAIPNLMLNTENQSNNLDKNWLNKCRFFHGDWASLSNIVDIQFDIILTTETIYNVDNYIKLINVFERLLKPEGSVYLAAKVYYFGVGGCIYDFQTKLEEYGFKFNNCWEQSDGVKRKIIQIVKVNDDGSTDRIKEVTT